LQQFAKNAVVTFFLCVKPVDKYQLIDRDALRSSIN